MSDLVSTTEKTSEYVKIPHIVGLYRNTRTGNYYGEKKVKGKRREKSLGTTDRKIAERRLKEWMANLDKVDVEVEKTTLGHLFASFQKTRKGKSESSQDIIALVLNSFTKWCPHGLTFQVRNVRPSHLEEWLALLEKKHRNATYNRYAGVLKQVFELAVKDRMIVESPFEKVATKSKRPQKLHRTVPTLEQFEAIVQSVRAQADSSNAEESGDFLEFLGLAGVGQAEASSLVWQDVDWAKNEIRFRRHKTDTHFTVPIYAHLKPLLVKLRQKAGSQASSRDRVLKIKNGRNALANACKRLLLPHFSQRNLRQCLIRRLWQAGVDRKLIAKWQGHQDGGQLIMDTYTEVFGSDDAEYERQQLAKLQEPQPGVIAASEAPAPLSLVDKHTVPDKPNRKGAAA